MTQSFGARLRAQREERRVSLETISAKLKIRVSLLEQLESDRVTYWPRGIFGRAYLRDYAREIGMEPESVVREFVMRYPETGDDPSWPPRQTQPARASAPVAPPPAPEAPAPIVLASTPALEAEPAIVLPAEPEAEPAQPLLITPPAVTERRRGEDRRELSLSAAADVCSRLGRALDASDITALLADAARLLDAAGVVVWLWDTRASSLRAWIAHGYSSAALARLPAVRADDTNAIAAAYRSQATCVVDSSNGSPGAIVVPSVGPSGCVGVLALEVRHGGEQNTSLRAFATILAAQLGTLLIPGAEPNPSPA